MCAPAYTCAFVGSQKGQKPRRGVSGAKLGQGRRRPVTAYPLVPLAFEPRVCVIKRQTLRWKERAEMKPKRGRMLIVGNLSSRFYGFTVLVSILRHVYLVYNKICSSVRGSWTTSPGP